MLNLRDFCYKRVPSRFVNLAALQPEDIDVGDIIEVLDNVGRFGGCKSRGYPDHLTVLQHQYLVYLLMVEDGYEDPLMLYAGLMHDAHEAYIGDFGTPVKRLLGINDKDVERPVREALGLNRPDIAWEDIKKYDTLSLDIERRVCFSTIDDNDDDYWPVPFEHLTKYQCHYWHSRASQICTRIFRFKHDYLRRQI